MVNSRNRSQKGTGDVAAPLAGDQALAKARELLPTFQTAMFITRFRDGSDMHVRPMGMLGDRSTFGGALWFFANAQSEKVLEVNEDPSCSVIAQNDQAHTYLHLLGTAVVEDDMARKRELFTPLVKTWFPEGLDDPDLTLIRFDAYRGYYWDSPGGILRVLAAFTKAVVTGIPGQGGNAGAMEL